MLNGLENLHGFRLPKKLWKCSKRWLKEDNPLGGVLFYKSKFLVSYTWSCNDPAGHNRIHPLPPLQVTVQSIQKMRDWVQTSALCQTGNNDGNSWNSPFVPLSEKNLALHFSLTSRSSKKTTGNRKKRKMDNYCTIPRVMMVTTHLWNKRLIFTWEG